MVHRALELPQGSHRIHPLPNQVAGVEVGAQNIPHRGPQAQQGGRVVHAEAGMHLKGYFFHAVGFSDIRRFFPVRDQHIIPLVLQGFAILGRPRRR